MKIVVCAKQVPDTNEVRIDPVRGTLIREGVPSILNPDDANALEAALTLKAQHPGSTVAVISMGPPQAEIMLRECLAMGADEAYLLSSRAFGGADTSATSSTLAAGIRKLGKFDIIFTGRQAIDGDTAQVGPQLASRLGVPLVTYVQGAQFAEGRVLAQRQLEDGYEVVEVALPCLLACVKEMNAPRYMTVRGIVEAFEKPVVVWNEADVALAPDLCGLAASPTQVLRSFAPPPRGKGAVLCGSACDAACALVGELRKKHLI